MLGELTLDLKSYFESWTPFEPSFTQFTQFDENNLAIKV